MAKHLEPAIPEECLINKLSYHYDEEVIRARRGSQLKTIQAMTELLENYEKEEYYRQSRRRNDRSEPRTYPNNNHGMNNTNMGYQGSRVYPQNSSYNNNSNSNNNNTVKNNTNPIMVIRVTETNTLQTLIVREAPIIIMIVTIIICLLYTSRCV